MTEFNRVEYKREQDDFFAGYSMPRNKTLMRVFKDLELVEYLGSGMPRILKAYSREAYAFSSHFIRARFREHTMKCSTASVFPAAHNRFERKKG